MSVRAYLGIHWFAMFAFLCSLLILGLLAGGIVHTSTWWVVLYGYNLGWSGERLFGASA